MNDLSRHDAIPPGGIDPSISCSLCPSACCRKGMTIRLNNAEHDTLVSAGTKLRPVTRKEIRELGRNDRPSKTEQTYMLESDCGNLSIDPETGATACSIYESDEYPKACTALKMGSYSCGLIQLTRVVQGQDTLDHSESEVLQR